MRPRFLLVMVLGSLVALAATATAHAAFPGANGRIAEAAAFGDQSEPREVLTVNPDGSRDAARERHIPAGLRRAVPVVVARRHKARLGKGARQPSGLLRPRSRDRQRERHRPGHAGRARAKTRSPRGRPTAPGSPSSTAATSTSSASRSAVQTRTLRTPPSRRTRPHGRPTGGRSPTSASTAPTGTST